MSNRINTVTVILEEEIRDDDCEVILNAIRMIKGVLSVTPNIANVGEYMAIERARHDLKKKLWNAFYSE